MTLAPTPGADDPAARLVAALERLQRLHPKVIDLSLDRLDALLARLGRPERALAPVVHVAGTNGKGSTVAFVRAVLEAAGQRVHAYTSPHLVRFNERVVLAGRTIEDRPLADLLDRLEQVNDGRPITYFEITTAAALTAFAETPADAVLLEVGMGGRLDATNVVDRPAVSAITRVSMDHRAFLGDTLAAIAGEKAGIARHQGPLVVGPQHPTAGAVIRRYARSIEAHLSMAGEDWRIDHQADGFVRHDEHGRRRFADPPLLGRHQRDNLAVAIGCLDVFLGRPVTPEEVAGAHDRLHWPGRLQRLNHGPLVDGAPEGWRLWLDGGHNDSAGAALADWAARRPPLPDGGRPPLALLVGMLDSKTPEEFLAPLAAEATALAAIAIPGEPAGLPAAALAAVATAVGLPARAYETPAAALAGLTEAAPPGDLLITGSLYLAGRILAEHG